MPELLVFRLKSLNTTPESLNGLLGLIFSLGAFALDITAQAEPFPRLIRAEGLTAVWTGFCHGLHLLKAIRSGQIRPSAKH
jgi:hypothetical protein